MPDGVVGELGCGLDGALPALLLGAAADGVVPGGPGAGAPGPFGAELLAPATGVVPLADGGLAGHGIIVAFGFDAGTPCCVPGAGAAGVVGAGGVWDAPGPAAFVVIGVGGPMVVAGGVVVAGGAGVAGAVVGAGAAGAAAGVAACGAVVGGAGGGGVLRCAPAHAALEIRITSAMKFFFILQNPPANRQKRARESPNLERTGMSIN